MQTEEIILERLVETVRMGGAVCLLGAGYSTAATDQNNVGIPSSTDLISEIKLAVGIDVNEYATLSDIADYCEDSPERQRALRLLLINRLTLSSPSDAQREIANQPWRSIFTTNFDDTIERCLPTGLCQVITPVADPHVHASDKTPLYYMHGRAKDLVETDIDPRLVISERNYLQLHEDNRSLYARLKNELFCASLIVVIGYSMRDLEIARILIDGGHAFRQKTILICDTKETPLAISRLKKFGSVLPIGLKGFFDALSKKPATSKPDQQSYQFIDKILPIAPDSVIEGDDFIRLILTGAFSRAKYQTQMQQPSGSPELYCVRRSSALDTILNRNVSGASRFVVSADLGNGKSIFLDELSEELLATGQQVFRISSSLEEVFDDIEKALSSSQATFFLIDDVIRHRKVAQFIGTRLNALSSLVCCLRGDPGGNSFSDLAGSLGGAVRQVDLDRLSPQELSDWDTALERWGLWEQRIALSEKERIKFLSDECSSENRSIVLSLFKNSQIATKIDQIVSFFLRDGNHEKAFAAMLISSLCQRHVSWESIVSWLDIDEDLLRRDIINSEIAALFVNGRQWNAFTSAQLADYILRTKYVDHDRDTLVEVFSTIVLCTAESAGDNRLGLMFRENLKELMKFRFLTRLFGDNDSAVKLIGSVYSRLSKARFIRGNPQFWLQYAMSRMEAKDLYNAETYLNTALGLAKDRGVDYSPFQILDQRARLYFMRNSETLKSFKTAEISTAVKDLKSLLDHPGGEIIYLYRSVPLIGQFIEAHIDGISVDMKSDIRSLIEGIKERGSAYQRLPKSQKGETRKLQKDLADALITLNYG